MVSRIVSRTRASSILTLRPQSASPTRTPSGLITDTLFGLWATVNNLTRLRPTRRERYRVTIFGSARTQPGHWVYQEVKRTGRAR